MHKAETMQRWQGVQSESVDEIMNSGRCSRERGIHQAGTCCEASAPLLSVSSLMPPIHPHQSIFL
eukprot:2271130-Amphidinium_carterae.1